MKFSADFYDDENIDEIVRILKDDVSMRKTFVDQMKNTISIDTGFVYMLASEKLFEKFEENNILTKDFYQYIFDNIRTKREMEIYANNRVLSLYFIRKNVIPFEELVRKCSWRDNDNHSCLQYLLKGYDVDSEIKNKFSIARGVLSLELDRPSYLVRRFKKDLLYLLDKVQTVNEVKSFYKNRSFLMHCFQNFVLNSNHIEKFDSLLHTVSNVKSGFFDSIKVAYETDAEMLSTAESYRIFQLKYSEKEKRELFHILKNSDNSREIFKQIVDSNLADQYSFEQLKELITKDSKKKKVKLNF